MYSEDDLLPVSALTDMVFCERRAALHQLEGIWEENVATVEGHHLHDKVHDGEEESRGDMRIARALRIRSIRLGLSGVTDVVEFHRVEDASTSIVLPQATGRWILFPVEYKRGILRHEESFEVQLCAQALCLEEMLTCSIPSGALFYGITRRRKDVAFTPALRHMTEQAAERLHELIDRGETPPAVYEKKCERCSLLNVCMPKTTARTKSAIGYLQELLE
jgi:CRISPR-associated exonuclease Cas4